MPTDAERMLALFEGFDGAHGTHGLTSPSAAKGGKQEIKKTARTVREKVTSDLWQEHLDGTRPIGIIPIRADGTCYWGCIDIDQYDIKHGKIVEDIEKRGLPLVVCKTKSGGAHVFLFLREPAPAEDVRALLRQISARLGWGDSEIFPKQSQILGERGDLGNWLNMPYLGGNETTRYAVKKGGGGMTVTEFLNFAEKRRVLLSEVEEPEDPPDETLNDGPPCLQHLASVGFPDGSRNNGLFSLGVFCKRKFGERWTEMLEKYNREYMVPPLDSEEVQSVIRSLEKKDYQYKCKDQPCVDYCNSALCKTRKFGIGGGGRYPSISGLSKLDAGENTLWFLDVEDQRIELTTTQLQNYREFQRVAMEALTVFFLPMKAETWAAMVGEAMENATIIEPAPEVTTLGVFNELLERFCTNSHRGTQIEEMKLGKPVLFEERVYFRLQDLMAFLDRAAFKSWGRNTIGLRLEEIGGRKVWNINNRTSIASYWVPETYFAPREGVPLPASKREPI